MEDSLITFLVLFGISVPTLALLYLAKFSSRKQKKQVKTVKEENTESISISYQNSITVLKEQNEFLMAENKTIKKRLAAEIGVKLREHESEIEVETKITSNNLQDYYEIDLSNGLKLVESMNIPFLKDMDKSKIPQLVNNPMIKKKIWSYIKENKDEMIDLGVIVPIGSMKDDKVVEKTEVKEESSNIMNLSFGNENGKYMA